MFERLSAPILACCNSCCLSAVFCAWLPFRAHCLANCLRAKDVKLSSFCKPEGHRFKVQMDMEFMAKQSYQQKRGSKIPLALPLCFFFPRLPPPCAVRGPGEVLYFARFPWAAFHWDRYLSRFCWILKTLHSFTKFLIHSDIELKQGNYTVDTETAKSLVLWLCRMFFLVLFVKCYDSMQLKPITVATCQRMRSRWFPRLPLPGVDVVSTFDIAFGEPGWAAAAKACLSSDSVWYEQKSHGSLIKNDKCLYCFPSCQGLRYFNLSVIYLLKAIIQK